MKSNVVCQKDIAEELGISVNTVSHALRGLSDISEETIQKVRDKAVELGYVPNSMAIKLKSGSSKTIALIYDNLTNPYFTIMASKLSSLIKKNGYDTIIYQCQSNYEVDAKLLNDLIASQVDGVLSFLDFDEKIVDTKAFKSIPIVLVGRLSKYNITSVYSDDFNGGVLIGNYLKKSGCKNVLFIAPAHIEASSRRYKGLCTVYPNSKSLHFTEGEDEGRVIDEIKKSNIDAVFAFNDSIACMINREIKRQQLNIKIVGFDSIYCELPFFYELTSVKHDFDKLADVSVNELFNRIRLNKESFNYETKRIMIPVALHIKEENDL